MGIYTKLAVSPNLLLRAELPGSQEERHPFIMEGPVRAMTHPKMTPAVPVHPFTAPLERLSPESSALSALAPPP